MSNTIQGLPQSGIDSSAGAGLGSNLGRRPNRTS